MRGMWNHLFPCGTCKMTHFHEWHVNWLICRRPRDIWNNSFPWDLDAAVVGCLRPARVIWLIHCKPYKIYTRLHSYISEYIYIRIHSIQSNVYVYVYNIHVYIPYSCAGMWYVYMCLYDYDYIHAYTYTHTIYVPATIHANKIQW